MKLNETIRIAVVALALSGATACENRPDTAQLTCDEIRAKIAEVKEEKCRACPNGYALAAFAKGREERLKALETVAASKNCE